MNVKRFLPILLSVSTSAIVLSGCSDFDNGFDAKEVAYQETFQQAFKNVDPNHNWSTATQGTAKIDVPAGFYTVKIYTANPRYSENRAYMLAQYDNVEGGGTKEFKFDMPANLDYVYVGLIDENSDRMILPAEIKNGAIKVAFPAMNSAATRSVLTEGDAVVTVSEAPKWEFGYDDVLPVLQTLPERNNNVGAVTQNLHYVSMGKFTIYPMYSVTDNQGRDNGGLILGVYYYDSNNEIHKVDVWKKTADPVWMEAYAYHAEDNQNWVSWAGYTSQVFNWEGEEGKGIPTGWKSPYTQLRSTGITIDIPVGTKFGFYYGTSNGDLYSEKELNENAHYSSFDGFQCYAASFHKDGKLFLCFEDWFYSSSSTDRDFNDVVFGFHGSVADPIIIDKDEEVATMSYMVACEDLGGFLDFDFNDVVFAIQHASGQNNAKIQLRAAGGTLPVKIKYNSDYITFGTKTELHDVFNVDVETPVNVGGYGADFILSDDFSVSANTFTVVEDAKDFKIEVTYSEGDVQSTIGVPDKEGGKVPQAFLVADPNWIWPSEGQDIRSKYSDFSTWVSDHLHTNWYESVWGNVNEQKSVPDGATDLTNGSVGGIIVSYAQDKKSATITIPNSTFGEEEAYKLVLKSAKDVNVSFTLGGENMNIMPSGTAYAGKVTTFTFNQSAIEAIKSNTGDVVLTLTYANSGATDDIQLLYWSGNIGEDGSGGSGSEPTTTPGFTIATQSESVNWGTAFKVTIAEDAINTAKNGKITVNYTGVNSQVFLAYSNGNQILAQNNAGNTNVFTIEASTLSNISNDGSFYIGAFNEGITVESVIYEVVEE